MTEQEIDNMKYMVCCPMCDNDKCVKGTAKCEAEKWKWEKMQERNWWNGMAN
jgi:hypothetical protein